MNTEISKIKIANNADVDYLINRFIHGPEFALPFVFEDEQLWTRFLEAIGTSLEAFSEKYYYYDANRKIHVAESEDGYVWISTMGLVAMSRLTDNKSVNASYNQAHILNFLLNEAIEICTLADVYDIDSYSYSRLKDLSLSLFHNTVFYFELLSKAYLSLKGISFPTNHKLIDLLPIVKSTMYLKGENNTLFHAYIIPTFEAIVNHISSLPSEFKEQYIKYDDNPRDLTIISFDAKNLKELSDIITLSNDVILEMYYDPGASVYLQPGLYERLIDKCKSAKAKDSIRKVYSFLIGDKDS